jgi:hypothetical protein
MRTAARPTLAIVESDRDERFPIRGTSPGTNVTVLGKPADSALGEFEQVYRATSTR